MSSKQFFDLDPDIDSHVRQAVVDGDPDTTRYFVKKKVGDVRRACYTDVDGTKKWFDVKAMPSRTRNDDGSWGDWTDTDECTIEITAQVLARKASACEPK